MPARSATASSGRTASTAASRSKAADVTRSKKTATKIKTTSRKITKSNENDEDDEENEEEEEESRNDGVQVEIDAENVRGNGEEEVVRSKSSTKTSKSSKSTKTGVKAKTSSRTKSKTTKSAMQAPAGVLTPRANRLAPGGPDDFADVSDEDGFRDEELGDVHRSGPSRAHLRAEATRTPGKHASPSKSARVHPDAGKGKEVGMPEDYITTYLDNYDLEAQSRLEKLRAQLELSVQAAQSRMAVSIGRIPRAVRELPLGEFIDEYGADIHSFMSRGPIDRFEVRKREYEEAAANSPQKRTGATAESSSPSSTARNAKAARCTVASPSKLDGKGKAPAISASAGTARNTRTGARGASSSTKSSRASRTTRTRAASAAPSSPAKASSSSTRPPSSATFAPRLGSAVPATPRSAGRAGRPGERISYQSLNGSPIFGVVGPDRVVQPDASETGEFADALEGTEGVSGLGGSDPDFDLPDEAAYTAEVLAAAEAQRGAASSSSAGSGSGSSSTTIIGRKGKGARASITLGATGRELDLATASPEDLEGCSPETRKKAREAKLKWLEEQRARWGI